MPDINMDGTIVKVDSMKFKVTGQAPLGDTFPKIGSRVTGVWRGEVTGWDVREKDGSTTAFANVSLSFADLEIVPADPGLFDDVQNLDTPPTKVDPDTGEIL